MGPRANQWTIGSIVMARAPLEALTARAIREGKSLRALVNELLAAAADDSR